MKKFVLVALLLAFTTVGLSDPTGENTCHVYYNETKQINTTYHQQARKSYTKFCLETITFKCVRYKNIVEVKWKTENITRLKMRVECCDGYQESKSGECKPHCSDPCVFGTCVLPETCACDPGYTGQRCEVTGCPAGGWGRDCSQVCTCQNGGSCNPIHGGCTCPPGYHGARCQSTCPENTYGAGCAKKCACDVGTTCNHVTGDCVSCKQGLYGEGCKKKCACLPDATEFCNPSDGKCFCKENRFGLFCEKLCPFGFINNTCLTTPLHNNSCQCPNHLYFCDLDKGCVCPEGVNCGIQLSDQVVELSALFNTEEVTGESSSVTVPVILVLLVSLLVIILLLVYYRRRVKVLKTDLENRSFRWFSQPGTNPSVSPNEYVIEDEHPLSENLVQNNINSNTGNSIIKQNNLQGISVLNNQLHFNSQHYHGDNPVYRQYHDNPGSNSTQPYHDLGSNSTQKTQIQSEFDSRNEPGPSRVHEKNVNCEQLNFKSQQGDFGKCEQLRVDLSGSDKLACKKGLTVDLSGKKGLSSCQESDDEDSCSQAVGGGCCQQADVEEGSYHQQAAVSRDVNVLYEDAQDEKVMKPSVSLTFKNNLRDETPKRNSDRAEDEIHGGHGGGGCQDNLSRMENDADDCCNMRDSCK